MDLGFFLCGLDRATNANVSQFTVNGKSVKSAFVLEAGVVNITTDPVKGGNRGEWVRRGDRLGLRCLRGLGRLNLVLLIAMSKIFTCNLNVAY